MPNKVNSNAIVSTSIKNLLYFNIAEICVVYFEDKCCLVNWLQAIRHNMHFFN